MSKDSDADADGAILSDFRGGMASWADAVQGHKPAPPDLNFARSRYLAYQTGPLLRSARKTCPLGAEEG